MKDPLYRALPLLPTAADLPENMSAGTFSAVKDLNPNRNIKFELPIAFKPSMSLRPLLPTETPDFTPVASLGVTAIWFKIVQAEPDLEESWEDRRKKKRMDGPSVSPVPSPEVSGHP